MASGFDKFFDRLITGEVAQLLMCSAPLDSCELQCSWLPVASHVTLMQTDVVVVAVWRHLHGPR
jgi:hypothetical protein